MKVSINISMPDKIEADQRYRSLCEKVEDYIFVCESDQDSDYHWKYLKSLYNKLHEKKRLSPEYTDMMIKLEDFISKYGQFDSGDSPANMSAETMFKYKNLKEDRR